MIQENIYNVISGSADVAAIVGTRIYPMRLPQRAEIPAVSYQILSTEPVTSVSGDSGIDMHALEVRSWGNSYAQAHELSEEVRTALLNEPGLKIITESQVDDEDLETRNYCVITQYSVWSEFDDSARSFLLLEDETTLALEGD